MNTPIVDFVKRYKESDPVRLHMPGHKGVSFLGCEPWDITEVVGADVLYSPNGIIAESEKNASEIFGSHHSFFSTEGSSLAIKAMLAMATSGYTEDKPLILAARNVHKSFVYACALLDLDVEWIIPPQSSSHLCSCHITSEELDSAINSAFKKPEAVYLTSPDYLGNILDISALSNVCHKYDIPLIVDNAHGAYLSFLTPSLHPLDLGADLCCDSAHKTLPVLTGGAYVHVSKNAPEKFKDITAFRNMLSVFASTSPSYLTLQSLDLCNRYISDKYKEKLSSHIQKLDQLKTTLSEAGYSVLPSEPLKTVILCSAYGYTGHEIAKILHDHNIECEFSDNTHIVFMSTPENTDKELEWLLLSLIEIPPKLPLAISESQAITSCPQKYLSIKDAIFSKRETVSAEKAVGRICAAPSVSCPPAVPVLISGELVESTHVDIFKENGIFEIEVVIK